MFRWAWIAFSSIFVVVGLVIMGFGINSLSRASDSESWPSAEGVVISSEVERHRSRDSGTTYSAEILYEYVVNGETLSGNSIKFGEVSTGNSSNARRYVNKYREGKTVKVYYNEEDPYEAVLEPGVHASAWFIPVFGAVFALFGSGFVAIGFFMGRVRSATDMSQEEMLSVIGCNSSDAPGNPRQGMVPAGPRGEILAENITAWGREHVGTGDDTLIDWHILSSRDEGHLSYVEVEPTPQEVGYDKFVFVISFADEPATLIATYCFENGKYLMFSSNADLEDELPDTLSW